MVQALHLIADSHLILILRLGFEIFFIIIIPYMKTFIKKIYRALPFKKDIFSLLKKIWSPKETVYRHLYFNGIIRVKVDEQHDFKIVHYGYQIENELFWDGLFGGWEKHSMKLWTALSKESKVIFDIGANTGIYTLVSKAINPTATVHTFEPFPAIYKKMVHNLAINGFNVNANCIAVSNYSGDAVIYTGDPDFAYPVTVNQNLWVKDKEPIEIKIKTITLKDYIEVNNITQIDLMKIDVELHEPEVMEGFAEYFEKFKPVLLIEILNEEIAQKLNNYFDSEAYSFYNIDERKGMKKTKFLSKSDFYNYLIVPGAKQEWFNKLF